MGLKDSFFVKQLKTEPDSPLIHHVYEIPLVEKLFFLKKLKMIALGQ